MSATHLLKQTKVMALQFTGPEQISTLTATPWGATAWEDAEGVHIDTINSDIVIAVGDWIVKSMHALLKEPTFVVVPNASFGDLFEAIT